ncbi:MAG TPA: cell division protein FtsX [Psychromonas hadalis]|nr:cell division protein FtsX [Psychromonas hadalis]
MFKSKKSETKQRNKTEKENILSGSPRINKISLAGRFVESIKQNARQVIASFTGLWRTPFATLMTVCVLGMALSLPSVFNLLYKNIEQASEQWDTASEVSLFLKKNISDEQRQVLINKLSLFDDIETVTYISKSQAIKEFKEMSGFSEALNYLDENPLPSVLVIVPTAKAKNVAGSKLLVAKLKREQDIDLVRVDLDWIEKLQAIVSLFVDAVIGIAVLLLISVLLIVSNTVRLNILNHRPEIEVFKLVGATNSFIQRPYLYAGGWYGFLGGVTAWLLTLVMAGWLESGISGVMSLYQTQFSMSLMTLEEVGILIGIATALGFIASYISVKQYLVKIEPK